MVHHWKRAFMLIAVLCLVPALPPAVAAGAEPPPLADTDNPAATTHIKAFDDLPAGLAGALARSLAGELSPDYHFSPTEGGVETANPAQSLAFTFTPAGVQVRDAAGAWTWGLALEGIGRGAQIAPVPAAELVAEDTRLEYRRGSQVTEWYLNSTWGLEQGFTLASPQPTFQGRRGIERGGLILQLALSGDLQAEQDGDDALLLHDDEGQAVARYAGLHAYDASGRSLPATLALAHGGRSLAIQVDDSGARYPVTVDPWIQVAQFKGEEAGEDLLGMSVAIDGDTVVAGAPYDDDNGYQTGAVYVFSGAGGWTGILTEVAKLTPTDPVAPASWFGCSVAISGDTIVVGSCWSQTVHVFEKAAGGWGATTGEVAKLTTSDSGGYLGNSVAIDDTAATIVVGAPKTHIGANIQQGAAYVYVRPGAHWAGTQTEDARLTASDGVSSDQLGLSVGISGDTIVAGVSFAMVGVNYIQGAAYVFVKPTAGWSGPQTEAAKLTASDGQGGDFLGGSVAISGDTVVAGAHGAEVGVNWMQGAAYVFVEPTAGWSGPQTETAKLTASDGVEQDMFGGSVAINGDTVVAGVPESTVGGSPRQGRAYVYVRPAGGWADTSAFDARLTASDGAAHETLAESLAISGDTVVAGAPGYRSGRGAAYVFEKPGPGWSGPQTEAAKLLASDGGAGDAFGTSVALEGDTLVVGAPEAVVDGKPAQGAVYVYVKSASGWPDTSGYSAKLTASDGRGGDFLGGSVAISGGTIVAGAPNAPVGSNEYQGAAYVFEKPPGGWSGPQTEAAKLVASDGAERHFLGTSVAISGDTVVAGSVYVFIKPPGGWAGTLTEAARLTASDGSRLGASVAISEDIIAAGAPWDQVVAGGHNGAVYVFERPATGWSGILTEDARLIATDPCAFCSLGGSVDVAGDTVVAGDKDAIVPGRGNPGVVQVFLKPATGWSGIVVPTAALSADDPGGGKQLGTSVAIYADTIVAGAPWATVGSILQGAVYVFDKPASGWASVSGHSAKLSAGDGQQQDRLGESVAICGNTVAAGAPDYRSKQGAVYLFEAEPGAIIVKKETQPGGGTGFRFSQDIDGSGNFTLNDGGSQTFLEVGPGQYTVTELGPPGGYDLGNLVCEDGNPDGVASSVDLETRTATVNLDRGETVTCTFTNARRGTIVVEKQTYPAGDPGPFAFQGTLTGSLGDGEQLRTKVQPGTYTVREVVPAGWDLTSVKCDDSNSQGDTAQEKAVFKVAPGEMVTCTFTNSQQGTVTIVKEAQPHSAQAFPFEGDLGAFGLSDDGQGYNARTVKNLDPGRYTVREVVPDGWRLADIRCADQDGGTTVDIGKAQAIIDLDKGEAIVCTFTNQQAGTLVVAQETVPPGDPSAFPYTGDVVGQARDGQRLIQGGLPAGTYTSQQLVPQGWWLTAIQCDDGESSGDLETATATFRLQPAETVTCTFSNLRPDNVYLPLVLR